MGPTGPLDSGVPFRPGIFTQGHRVSTEESPLNKTLQAPDARSRTSSGPSCGPASLNRNSRRPPST